MFKYLSLGTLASSQTIPIENAGFEAAEDYFVTYPLPPNVYRYESEAKQDPHITGWTFYDLTGKYKHWSAGINNPLGGNPGAYGGRGNPDGSPQSLYLKMEKKDDGKGEIGITQTLSATVIENTVYNLYVDVGNTGDNNWDSQSTGGGGTVITKGFPGYRVDLMSEDGNVLVSDNNSKFESDELNDEQWAVSYIQYIAQPADIGKRLRIRLVNLNICQDVCPGYREVNYDNVTLESYKITTTAPTTEPTTEPTTQPTMRPTRDRVQSNEISAYLQLMSGIFCGVITLIILFITLYHIKMFRTSNIPKPIKQLTHLVNTMALLSSSSVVIYLLYPYFANKPLRNTVSNIFGVICGVITNAFIQPTAYLIYVLRLKYIFENSVYKITPFVLVIVLMFFSGLLGTNIYLQYYHFVRGTWKPTDISREQIQDGLERGQSLTQIFAFTIYFGLIFLFTLKLFRAIELTRRYSQYRYDSFLESMHKNQQMIEMSSRETTNSNSNSKKIIKTPLLQNTAIGFGSLPIRPPKKFTKIYFNDHQAALMYVVTRITVLLTISILSSIILIYIRRFIKSITDGRHDASRSNYDFYLRWSISTIYQCVYCLIDVICLLLNYSKHNTIYRFLCCCCNSCCYLCCKWANWCCVVRHKMHVSANLVDTDSQLEDLEALSMSKETQNAESD